MKNTLQMLLALMTSCLLAASTFAQSGTSGAVMVMGATPQQTRIVSTTVSESLIAAGWTIKAVSFTEKETAAARKCPPTGDAVDCVKRILLRHGVSRVAIVRLSPDAKNGELGIFLRLIVPGAVGSIPTKQKFCPNCADDKLKNSLRELTAEAVAQLGIANGRTVLEVVSVPTSAAFLVDGTTMGLTNQSIPIAPGPHKVSIELSGYVTQERDVTGVEGQTTRVEIKLVPRGQSNPGDVAKGGSGVIPLSASSVTTPTNVGTVPAARSSNGKLFLMTGLTAMGAGGLLILLNTEDTFAPIGQAQKKYYYPTKWPGVALASAGLVVASVGVYQLLATPKATTVPVVALVEGGALFSLFGGF